MQRCQCLPRPRIPQSFEELIKWIFHSAAFFNLSAPPRIPRVYRVCLLFSSLKNSIDPSDESDLPPTESDSETESDPVESMSESCPEQLASPSASNSSETLDELDAWSQQSFDAWSQTLRLSASQCCLALY